MTYNIHPIFVHFPIALLFVYSIIKIIPFKKWFSTIAWKHIEIVLLVTGVLGAFVASATGEIAEELTNQSHQLVEMHATFAAAATWMYGLLLAGELLALITPIVAQKYAIPKIVGISMWVQRILLDPVVSAVLAIGGLIAISITGLLGGVMVYGTTADPVAGIVLQLLGITL